MPVLITYFDEVKYEPETQRSYWLAGIAVEAGDVRAIEAQVSALAQDCFGSGRLSSSTEFHASALIGRRDHFKDWDTDKRITVLKRLLGILDQHDRLSKVYVRLFPARMVASDHEDKAFMFFTEKVDALLEQRSALGLLIGDRENDQNADATATALSGYRADGTWYDFGRNISRLIDTVHFTHSHLSRMLQLADLYAWTLQFCAKSFAEGTPQRDMQEFIRCDTKILWAHKYKEWPTDGSWLQVQPA